MPVLQDLTHQSVQVMEAYSDTISDEEVFDAYLKDFKEDKEN